MSVVVTLQEVAALAARLPPEEQRQLAAQLLRDKDASHIDRAAPRRLWREIRGIVAYPMCGEDAQAWVSRTRREAENHDKRDRIPLR
jgi:hypothetical protein